MRRHNLTSALAATLAAVAVVELPPDYGTPLFTEGRSRQFKGGSAHKPSGAAKIKREAKKNRNRKRR